MMNLSFFFVFIAIFDMNWFSLNTIISRILSSIPNSITFVSVVGLSKTSFPIYVWIKIKYLPLTNYQRLLFNSNIFDIFCYYAIYHSLFRIEIECKLVNSMITWILPNNIDVISYLSNLICRLIAEPESLGHSFLAV